MRTLIVYYSLSGHTREAAEMIAGKLGDCTLFELKGEKRRPKILTRLAGWPQSFLKKSETPESTPGFDGYDRVILGTPVWCRGLPPVVRGFLETANWEDINLSAYLTCRYGGDDGALREITSTVYERGGHVPQTMCLMRERFFGVEEADVAMALRNWVE